MTNLNHLKSIALAATSGEWKSIDGGEITGIRVDLVTATELIEELEAYREALQAVEHCLGYDIMSGDLHLRDDDYVKFIQGVVGELRDTAREVLRKFGGSDE